MTKYESNHDVQPVRVTTYRHLRKATRRGWAVPLEAEPSLADLASTIRSTSTSTSTSDRDSGASARL